MRLKKPSLLLKSGFRTKCSSFSVIGFHGQDSRNKPYIYDCLKQSSTYHLFCPLDGCHSRCAYCAHRGVEISKTCNFVAFYLERRGSKCEPYSNASLSRSHLSDLAHNGTSFIIHNFESSVFIKL